jgi:predicted TIM-barrel fold metal-dependent hydrolase
MASPTPFSRRRFISTVSGGSITAAVAAVLPSEAISANVNTPGDVPAITDTNIHLFQWPFRKLKYDNTRALVEKLRKHRISQAWAGSYESLFTKSIDVTNARLAKECRENGKGMLIPFGTVNPVWPDWEEDLRRCHEVHKMPGIRIYPGYQTIDLTHPGFAKLITEATKRSMIVQIVGDIDDTRVEHPIVETRKFKLDPLVDIVKNTPGANIQLLNWNLYVDNDLLTKLVAETNISFDIAWLESVGALGHSIEGKSWEGQQTPVPVERFLFGSNAPIFPVEASTIKLFESPLTLQQMKAVMNQNARKLIHDKATV